MYHREELLKVENATLPAGDRLSYGMIPEYFTPRHFVRQLRTKQQTKAQPKWAQVANSRQSFDTFT
jgi:hypothetical protein